MIYNPLDVRYKSIVGAIPSETNIKFRVKDYFDSVIFVVQKEKENVCCYNMYRKDGYFEYELSFTKGLYFYYFIVNNDKFISLNNCYLGEISEKKSLFQLTVYDKNYTVPTWLQGGIIYQIFPDRFNSVNATKIVDNNKILHKNLNDIPIYKPNEFGEVLNNDFFGGDLQGIVQKLDYLEEYGVTAIYLNPIFKAYSNHRYDTGDYMSIDSLLGTEEDLVDLINQAGKRGIKIILDGVFNHTGIDSLYFNKYKTYNSIGAYNGENSPYRDWYDFIEYPKVYNSWWGIKTLPAVNKAVDSPFIDFICGENGVLEHYTKLGIGGWRLDVVDELPAHFVERIRKAIKSCNKNAIVIGEVWEDASNKIAYGERRKYFLGNELDSVMNYPLKNAILGYVMSKDATQLSYTVKQLIDHYPKSVLQVTMNLLSTHDTYRLLSAVSDLDVSTKTKEEMENLVIPQEKLDDAIFNLKVATLLQFTMPGVPSIYYGDEIGMQGFSDPLNRKYFEWNNINVQISSWYKKISQIRKTYSAFTNGSFQEIYLQGGKYIYKIFDDNSEILVVFNLSDTTCELVFEGQMTELLHGFEVNDGYDVLPRSFCVFIKK